MRSFLTLLVITIALSAQAGTPVAPVTQAAGVSLSTHGVDLLQLYRESRLADPRVLSAYARARAGDAMQREALGGLLPQLGASASFNRTARDVQSYTEQFNNERYALTLSQHVYNRVAWANYEKFKALAKQRGLEADNAQAEAAVDLAQRYFAALAADDELALVMAERRTTQKNLDRVNSLYEKKLAMVTDVLDLRARVDALAAMEVEARNQVRVSRQALAEIVGRSIHEPLDRIRDDVIFGAPDEELQLLVDRAVSSNPALLARQRALDAADAALREGKGGHYPSLSLNLSAQRSDVGYDNTLAPRSDSYVASLGVQLPIFSGGSTSARVRGLYEDRLATEQELEAVRRQVVRETTSAFLTAQSSVEKIRASRRALESAEQSRIAAERGFQFGVVNAVDVLSSVQNEYKTRRDLLGAQYDFITNLLVLNRWTGSLSTTSIENVNQWLARSAQARALENTAE